MKLAQVHNPDYVFLGLAAALMVCGLLVLSSASSVIGFENFGDTYYFVKRQIFFGIIPGAFALWFFLKFDYHRLSRWSILAFLICLILLVVVLVPGVGLKIGFAQRWLRLGPIGLQPSELVKLGLALYLAAWFARPGRNMGKVAETVAPFALMTGLVLALIIMQPDIGTALVVTIIATGMYVLAGARQQHLAALGALFVAAIIVVILVKPHAVERVSTFLHPDRDPQGTGYQISQASLAIGSGGWFGQGFGHSRAKFKYLPEVYGDSIFAIIGEEMGFLLAVAFVGLYAIFFARGLVIARHAPDRFGQLLAGGLVLWLGGQALLNMSAIVGLVPLTGVPLPLVSYGGTALAVSLAAIGIIGNISNRGSVSNSRHNQTMI